ncbi:helix-turn-helix domain-containing protein [Xanthobacter sp. DSM 24535]|uniref:XRE family transcriptional regulator n=1 Tax=Roseixanthobacter psychrophilus TaxID=3119917 RepID=UPI0037274D41
MALKDRIKQARRARRWSQGKLGEAVGVSSQAVSQWESGASDVTLSRLREIAAALGMPVEWFTNTTGEPVPDQRPQAFTPQFVAGSELVGPRDFPVYAAAMGGTGHLIVTFEAIEVVKRPSILEGVRGAYGMLVMGDSMFPAYRQGDMALVHPGLPPAREEDVILYDHAPDGQVEAILKNLLSWTEQDWLLRQWQPAKEWRVAKVDWPICHRVVGKYARR